MGNSQGTMLSEVAGEVVIPSCSAIWDRTEGETTHMHTHTHARMHTHTHTMVLHVAFLVLYCDDVSRK